MPQLQFKGRATVLNHHAVVKYHQLLPVKKAGTSKSPTLDDNLVIHGDNLKALKALLPTHAGKAKCVYIDPPYNTGKKTWVYNDSLESPTMQDWLGKTVDANDLTRHDKWLCMMMPRLKLLRELMAGSGVIFVSIDDNEVGSLLLLMDEIFGRENRVGVIVWKNVTDNNPTNIATEHEYVVCYAKSKPDIAEAWKSQVSDTKDQLVKIGDDLAAKFKGKPLEDLKAAYAEWHSDHKFELGAMADYKFIDFGGVYAGSRAVHNPGKEGYRYDVIHPKTKKPCQEPMRGYRFAEDTMKKLLKEGKILFGEDHTSIIQLKVYAREYEEKLPSVLDLDGRAGPNEIKAIFADKGEKVFDTPKSSAMIETLLSFTTKGDDLVLDSFAGSGTTAQAVLALNKRDGGKRRFILIESEDYAEEVTAERVKRVIKGVQASKDEALKAGLGGSFAFFKLGEPIDMAAILSGKSLPDFMSLAKYVFYTATGQEFVAKEAKPKQFLIGSTSTHEVFLYYKPDRDWLKGSALTLDVAKGLERTNKRALVFAANKYLDQEHLDELRVDFAQLPFEIYGLARKAKG
jgi:adenine-specific DNA-methyltransferase